MLLKQLQYNKKIVGPGDQLSQELKEKITQDNVLCAHAELSALVNATNYKNHHQHSEPLANRRTVLYETVDVIRYMMATLNTWEITSSEFERAFEKKDVYLNKHYELQQKKWTGQPVAIVDIDDVLANFRVGFSDWLYEKFGVRADVDSKEYYFITALSKINLNSESVFKMFLDDEGFANLTIDTDNLEILWQLKNRGYWIHLLTARPEEELQCLYDTYFWIWQQNIPCDAISFSPEKFRWCAKSKYYDAGAIKFAIDDAPKHAEDYAKHGIKCLVPNKSYNEHLSHQDIFHFNTYSQAISILKSENLLR
tara:strand:+ start:6063 stop:6992 length:930 start_codon:yes stop_codon:yes gene_type:complete